MKLVREGTEEKHANQMSLISDTDEVIKFLEQAGEKAILNGHQVNCRLTACNNLFSILNEGEHHVDYLLQNLDLLVSRFRNKHSNVQASTLKVYKSRLKSSLEDYQQWLKDPVQWERSVHEKSKERPLKEKKVKAGKAIPTPAVKAKAPVEEKPLSPRSAGGSRKISFPLRADCSVEISLPADGITLKELLRLGLFLYPYCKDGDTRELPAAWPMVNVPHVTN